MMTRKEVLGSIAETLMLAASKAAELPTPEARFMRREVALTKQIEGIAMEFRAMAAAATPVRAGRSN